MSDDESEHNSERDEEEEEDNVGVRDREYDVYADVYILNNV